MFKLFIKRYFYYISIIALLFTLNSLKSFAVCEDQCPTDIPPVNIPWISMPSTVVYVTFPNGKICAYNVCYCWRSVGVVAPYIEVYVKGGGPVDPNCPPIEYIYDGPLVMRLLAEAILKQNPHNLPWICPPCPDEFIEYRAYYDRCWTNGISCNGNSYCQGIYHVCCTAGIKTITWISNSVLGDNCDTPCNGSCP
jgi:hypothetical protein